MLDRGSGCLPLSFLGGRVSGLVCLLRRYLDAHVSSALGPFLLAKPSVSTGDFWSEEVNDTPGTSLGVPLG